MFSHPPLSVDQLADNLISKGLKGERRAVIETIQAIGYYRLKGYWFDWRNANGNLPSFASLDLVKRRYDFDRRISGILFSAITDLETAIRSVVVESFYEEFPNESAPHLNKSCLYFHDQDHVDDYHDWLQAIKRNEGNRHSQIAKHYRNKYPHMDIPLWAAVELMSFSHVLRLLNFNTQVKNRGARRFGMMRGKDFLSAGFVMVALRNKIAHHDRVWNAKFVIRKQVIKILRRRYSTLAQELTQQSNYSIFVVCILMQIMLSQTNIAAPLSKLFADYPKDLIEQTGFPINWQDFF